MPRGLPEQGPRPVAAHPEQHIPGNSLNIHLEQQIPRGLTQSGEPGRITATQLQMSQQIPTGHQTFEPVFSIAAATPRRVRVRLQMRNIRLQQRDAPIRSRPIVEPQMGPTQRDQGVGPLMVRQLGQLLEALQQRDLNSHLRRTMGTLKQQPVHQFLPLPGRHAFQQAHHRFHITAAVGGAEPLLAAIPTGPPPPQLLHQLQ